MLLFLKKNNKAKIVILDIPLLLENKINDKNDILVFVESKKSEILKRLKKRKNFNLKIFKKFKDIQLSSSYKKKKSHFIIKNDFRKKSVKTGINNVLERIT
jgi:dephospho-CoA kinase